MKKSSIAFDYSTCEAVVCYVGHTLWWPIFNLGGLTINCSFIIRKLLSCALHHAGAEEAVASGVPRAPHDLWQSRTSIRSSMVTYGVSVDVNVQLWWGIKTLAVSP
jgi:hypothetical protein